MNTQNTLTVLLSQFVVWLIQRSDTGVFNPACHPPYSPPLTLNWPSRTCTMSRKQYTRRRPRVDLDFQLWHLPTLQEKNSQYSFRFHLYPQELKCQPYKGIAGARGRRKCLAHSRSSSKCCVPLSSISWILALEVLVELRGKFRKFSGQGATNVLTAPSSQQVSSEKNARWIESKTILCN
jgi:hypothetical protein